ncbi:DNA cytosine methyltransferase [Saccharospirillum alexandrii]|uniref:DNA cytosine methyltransferase n=1 Tax=Saccharospirillum alexandrii TaxID=2448477 RepID=UPI000FD86A3C|nr:DNA cytosine methyltransferase [Saccharospirillum alexandrii]
MAHYKFIDLFAGCGGLSLGLSLAGLEGLFAIEKDPMAFETFSANFLGKRKLPAKKFAWPFWLEQKAWGIDDLLAEHHTELTHLKGKIEILAGGPPCQGFSFAGRRQESDPRNLLFKRYVEVVEAIRPSALILENVPGMKVAHATKTDDGIRLQASESYYDKLKRDLEAIGYDVHCELMDASRFGVPQKRSRLIVLGLNNDISAKLDGGVHRVFQLLEEKRLEQLSKFRLPEIVTASDAISDLNTDHLLRQPCVDPYSPPGFEEAVYLGPNTTYQKLMNKHCRKDAMDSMRLARHRQEVRERFTRILEECKPGVLMDKESRERFGLKKHRIYLMSKDLPAPTITTLPDDVLHYAKPRILTVRESARIQSFPDWFRFSGKFTTGGPMRSQECPRYTQVGNAVPPFLARAIGLAVTAALEEASKVIKPNFCASSQTTQEEVVAAT